LRFGIFFLSFLDALFFLSRVPRVFYVCFVHTNKNVSDKFEVTRQLRTRAE
jgi:hypothetical protein